jgi:hypothetical protein
VRPNRKQIFSERCNPATNEWVAHVSPLRHGVQRHSTNLFTPTEKADSQKRNLGHPP